MTLAGDQTSVGPRPKLLTGGFVALLIAGVFYFLSWGTVVPVLPQFVKNKLNGGPIAVGIAVGSLAFSAVFLRAVVGSLIDRHGRRPFLAAGAVIAGLSNVGVGFANHFVLVVLLRLVAGVGEAFFFTAGATLANDLAPAERRGEAVSYFSISVYLGSGLGPALGENVLNHGSYRLAFAVAGGLGVIGGLLSLRVPAVVVPQRPQDAEPPRIIHRATLGPGSALCLGLMGYTAFQAFVPLYVKRFNAGSEVIFFVYALLLLLVRLVGARLPDRQGPVRVATASMITLAAGLILIGATGSLLGLYLGALVLACGNALQYPSLFALALRNAPDHDRAAVVGTFTGFFDLSAGIGGFLLGGVAALTNYRGAFVAGGICALIGLVVLRVVVTRHKEDFAFR